MGTVNFSPITAMLENNPPGTLVLGVPGGGKSFSLVNIAANSLLTNIRVIYLDGKNDALPLKDVYSDIDVIDINNIAEGALNPFRVLNDVDTSVIMSIITCMCGELGDSKTVSIMPIVRDFVIQSNKYGKNANMNFKDLANYLYASENEDAQTIGTMLKINEDSKYGKLLFSDKVSNEYLNLSTGSQIISLFGMNLPKGESL